jgi:hypothetical protein
LTQSKNIAKFASTSNTVEVQKMLLTTREAAELLRRKKSCLESWRCRGGGPAFIKIGRGVLYRESDLEAFLIAGRRTSTSDENRL